MGSLCVSMYASSCLWLCACVTVCAWLCKCSECCGCLCAAVTRSLAAPVCDRERWAEALAAVVCSTGRVSLA